MAREELEADPALLDALMLARRIDQSVKRRDGFDWINRQVLSLASSLRDAGYEGAADWVREIVDSEILPDEDVVIYKNLARNYPCGN